MEKIQATQIFLILGFIFIIVILGLYLKFIQKSCKASIVNAVQKPIIIVSIITLFIFGGSYYFIVSNGSSISQSLKDATSITSSFFSGLATLAGVYIAANLVENWRIKYNQEKLDKLINDTAKTCVEITTYFLYEYQEKIDLTKNKNKELISKFLTINTNDPENEIKNILKLIDESNKKILSKLTILSKDLHHNNLQLKIILNNQSKIPIFLENLSSLNSSLNRINVNFIEYKKDLIEHSFSRNWVEYSQKKKFETFWNKTLQTINISEIVATSESLQIELLQYDIKLKEI